MATVALKTRGWMRPRLGTKAAEEPLSGRLGHRYHSAGPVHAKLVGTDADGGLATFTPHHEASSLQIDRTDRFLLDRPVDAQFYVRADGKRPAAFEGHAFLAHVTGDPVAPVVLDSLLGLAIAKAELNSETQAPAPVVGSVRHGEGLLSVLSQCYRNLAGGAIRRPSVQVQDLPFAQVYDPELFTHQVFRSVANLPVWRRAFRA
jgi:hypothetical protein